MAEFIIKHKATGKFIHIIGCNNDNDFSKLAFTDDIHDNTKFQFVPVERVWGYLKHVKSGKTVRPSFIEGDENPTDFTNLVIHSEKCPSGLFAIDQINNVIVHKSGMFVHPQSVMDLPREGTGLILQAKKEAPNLEVLLVSPDNIDKESVMDLPKEGTGLILQAKKEAQNLEVLIVSPDNIDKEVFPKWV